jgi:branched-chain amino acid transport system substrate-binding protein
VNQFNFQRSILHHRRGILASATGGASAQDTIKIGEINSYKAQPAFLEPYRRAGRWPRTRSTPRRRAGQEAGSDRPRRQRQPRRLRARGRRTDGPRAVALLFGGFLSNTGLALTDYAKQHKVFFLAAEPLTDKIVWQNGNKYTYRLRPPPTCWWPPWSRKRPS